MTQSEEFVVLYVLCTLPSQLELRVSLVNCLGLHLGLYVCLWIVGVKDNLWG